MCSVPSPFATDTSLTKPCQQWKSPCRQRRRRRKSRRTKLASRRRLESASRTQGLKKSASGFRSEGANTGRAPTLDAVIFGTLFKHNMFAARSSPRPAPNAAAASNHMKRIIVLRESLLSTTDNKFPQLNMCNTIVSQPAAAGRPAARHHQALDQP